MRPLVPEWRELTMSPALVSRAWREEGGRSQHQAPGGDVNLVSQEQTHG